MGGQSSSHGEKLTELNDLLLGRGGKTLTGFESGLKGMTEMKRKGEAEERARNGTAEKGDKKVAN